MGNQFNSRAAQERRTHGAVTEAQARSRGTWMLWSGIALAGLTILAAAYWYIQVGEEPSVGVAIPLYGISFVLTSLGLSERTGRAGRERRQEAYERIEFGVFLLADMLPEERRRSWYEAYATGVCDTAASTGTEGPSARSGILRPVRDVAD